MAILEHVRSLEYFAALDWPGTSQADPERRRLIGELQSRIDSYYNWILMTNRLARWRVAYNTNYGQRGQHSSNFVTAGGEKGELSFLMSNEYRNLVQHTMVMATQSRTALETVATNTDSKSKSQSYVAKGLVEYYRRDGKIDANAYQAGETALVLDTGWVFNEWDIMMGMEVAADMDSGELLRQGDIKTRARTPLDVVFDVLKIDPLLQDWRMVRDPVNKYDLAAQHPEIAQELISLQRDLTQDALFRFGDIVNYQVGINSDDIDVWTFYHRRSPALPQGRMVQFTDRYCLFDGPIPYRRLPGNRICPSEQILSALGYSNANDLLGLQDVLDALVSSAVTNMTSLGVNNIWCEDPSNLDFEQLAQGMNLLGGGGSKKPEVLMLNRLPPEWQSLSEFVIQRMSSYMGMNQVARGNVEGKDFSGAAMALLQSMAIQFNSGFTRSLNKLTEDNGNDIIMMTQDFASEKRLGMIIGEHNRYMMKEYSGADIDQIQRTYCRQSNPLKDTTAGRLTIVQEASKTEGGLSKAEFAEILDTGNTDCLLEQGRNARLAIDQENEALMEGQIPPVVFCENHPAHIAKHAEIITSPDDKADPALIERVRQHVQMHLQTWQMTEPSILMAFNIPPYPQPMLAVPPPGAPVGQNAAPGPGVGGPPDAKGGKPAKPQAGPQLPPGPPPPPQVPPMLGAPTGMPQQQSPQQLPPGVNGPSLPINPLSGQRWNPQTGGLPGNAAALG